MRERAGAAARRCGGLAAAAALCSAPVWLVAAAAAASGAVGAGTAAALAVAAPAGAVLAARPLLAAAAGMARRLERLARGEAQPPPAPAAGLLADADAALRRLERSRAGAAAGDAPDPAERMLDALPDPILRIDGGNRIGFANRAAGALFGGGAGLVGREPAAVLRHPGVLQAVAAAARGDAAAAVPFAVPGRVERHFEARAIAVAGPGAEAPQSVLVLRDVTAARRSERQRADFVADVSHELRTPLSTLVGFIETLLGPARDDAAARQRFLDLMQAQAARMARLVADLLSLSHIEMEEHTPPDGRVDLAGVLRQTADLMAQQASRKGMPLEVEVAAGLPPARGDADQLTQLFQNLIDNAVKYGRAGTPIRIAAARDADGAVAVAVSDAGDGIPRAHLPRLTERFYRVDAARSRDLGGTGLGLAIVKHVVNRHRGRLEIDSAPGAGSTFRVTLPAAAG